MKAAYPIIMTKGKEYIVVTIPGFNSGTEGTDYADAMEMARDAIGILGIDMEDDGDPIPAPSALAEIAAAHPGEVVTLVDVDFAEYRRKNDNRAVRRNVSLPAWLDKAAREADVNVSAILTAALKRELNIQR